MIEVNLLGEETDLAHAKELYQMNTSEEDREVLDDILTLIFDGEMDADEKEAKLSEIFNSFPEEKGLNKTEVEVKEIVNGAEQLHNLLPQEFEYMEIVFQYLLDNGVELEEAEAAQEVLQDGNMDDIILTVPREGESMSGLLM